MKRKRGDQLLRDFAAEDARSMRRYGRRTLESSYDRAMEAYHRGRYNSYKLALQMINTESLWRDV
jgi:hypothetical protein